MSEIFKVTPGNEFCLRGGERVSISRSSPGAAFSQSQGAEFLAAQRYGAQTRFTLAVTDDVHVPCNGKGAGDRLTVWMKAGEDEFNEDAQLVSANGTTNVCRVTLGPVKGDTVRFNFCAQDDDGEGRDVRLTLPKARLFRFQ